MKKQILILTFLVLALMAGTSTAFGQLLPSTNGTAPAPMSCDGNDYPLHPLAGKPYYYHFTNPTGDATNWIWFATKDPAFITNGVLNPANRLDKVAGELIDYSANYNTDGTIDSVMITWTPEILAATKYQSTANVNGTAASPSPTFVVGYADGNCSNNLQVYEINPVVLFTVDIANIDASTNTMAYGADTSQCVDIVRGAAYNSTNFQMDMDYGADTLYFEVVAANFVTNWVPTFRASGGWTSPQTASMDLYDSKSDMLAGTNPINATPYSLTDGADFTGPTLTADASVTSTVGGVSLWVRVIIDNNTYESLAMQTFNLSVDGQDATGQWDMSDSDCADPAGASLDHVDQANHNINPRPTLNDATQDDEVVAPNTTITKTP